MGSTHQSHSFSLPAAGVYIFSVNHTDGRLAIARTTPPPSRNMGSRTGVVLDIRNATGIALGSFQIDGMRDVSGLGWFQQSVILSSSNIESKPSLISINSNTGNINWQIPQPGSNDQPINLIINNRAMVAYFTNDNGQGHFISNLTGGIIGAIPTNFTRLGRDASWSPDGHYLAVGSRRQIMIFRIQL